MQPSFVPAPGPSSPPLKPAAPAPEHGPRTPWKGIAAFAVIVLVAAAGYWAYQKQLSDQAAASRAAASVRTHTVQAGRLDNIIRITGVTTAEKFVSLVAPQMRLSRSDFGRDGSFRNSSGGANFGRSGGGGGGGNSGGGGGGNSGGGSGGGSTTASSGGSGGSGGSTSGGASASGGSSDVGGLSSGTASTGGQASSSAVSRNSRTVGRAATSTTSRTATASRPSVSSGSGLGSTSGQLGGGGGGNAGGGGGGGGGMGGGGGDFSMTLQNLAKPGSRVTKGQIVAEFDRQFMLNRLEDYKSSMAQLNASMKKLVSEIDLYIVQHRQTIDVAKANLEKAQLDMKTLPVRGEMDAERLRLALEEAQAQLKQLQGEVRLVDNSAAAQRKIAELEQKAAELELRRVQMTADRMLMKTPIDGITVMQQIFAGSEFRQIQEGDQIYPGQFFMQIVEPGSMVINSTVNQVDAERLRIGQKASVRFDAYPGLELKAHVVSVAAVTKTGGFRANFVKEIPVRLKLDTMDDRVIPDLSVSCDVVIDSEESKGEQSVIVPREGLFTDGEGATSKRFVWVRSGAGQWARRDVETGLSNHVQAVVRDGLKPGEVIALEQPPGTQSEKPPSRPS